MTTNRKYEINAEGRVVALRDFGNVKAGDVGGFVASEDNLSHAGDAWVYGDARVSDNARVHGNAWVSGNAWVHGDAWVYGNAWVSGDALVYGGAWVSGGARVYGGAWVSGDAWVYGGAQVSGDARVYGGAQVSGDARVYGDARVSGGTHKGAPAGTFDETLAEMPSATEVRPPEDGAVAAEVRVTDPATGGQKGQKPEQYSLIPTWPLAELARVYGFGAKKYAPNNWRKGYAWSLTLDALQRHVERFRDGESVDPESGLHHLAHAMFHLATAMVFDRERLGTDDRGDA